MTEKEKRQSQGPRGHHRPVPTRSTLVASRESQSIPGRTRSDCEQGESRSAGHEHVVATGPCLFPVDTISRTILKLTTQSNRESRTRSNGLLPRVLGGC